jgi:hypothetical protein
LKQKSKRSLKSRRTGNEMNTRFYSPYVYEWRCVLGPITSRPKKNTLRFVEMEFLWLMNGLNYWKFVFETTMSLCVVIDLQSHWNQENKKSWLWESLFWVKTMEN